MRPEAAPIVTIRKDDLISIHRGLDQIACLADRRSNDQHSYEIAAAASMMQRIIRHYLFSQSSPA